MSGTEMKFRLVRTEYDRKTTPQKARHILKGAAGYRATVMKDLSGWSPPPRLSGHDAFKRALCEVPQGPKRLLCWWPSFRCARASTPRGWHSSYKPGRRRTPRPGNLDGSEEQASDLRSGAALLPAPSSKANPENVPLRNLAAFKKESSAEGRAPFHA